MKKLFAIAAATLIALTTASAAYAGGTSNCQIIYGGGQVCQKNLKFTINKLVQKPGKGGGDFVENLTINDPRFAPGQSVQFKIVVENTGDTDITNLNVVDTFPQFVTFMSGVGNASAGNTQDTFVVGSLPKGKKAEFVITAKIADAANLPSDQTITCVTNNVVATAQDGSQGSDNAQLCIEKPIVNVQPTPQILEKPFVKNIPSTGPETDVLFGLVSTGALGYFLKRKVS